VVADRPRGAELVSVEATPSLWLVAYAHLKTRVEEVRRDAGHTPVTPAFDDLLRQMQKAASGPGFATLETCEPRVPAFVSTSQAAVIIGCSERHVRRLAREKRIRVVTQEGRDHLIERESAEQWRDRDRGSTGKAPDGGRKGRRATQPGQRRSASRPSRSG